MKIQKSAEDYLEAILVLRRNKGFVRSIDVAHYMGFSKPSISRAVGLLRDNGYVAIDDNGQLLLTESGRAIAENIYERHTVLTRMFVQLGVDETTAAEDACQVEHVISQKSFDALKAHLQQYHRELPDYPDHLNDPDPLDDQEHCERHEHSEQNENKD